MTNEPRVHIALDLETLDTRTTAAIVAAAIVVFDPETGSIYDRRSWRIDLDAELAAGFTVSKDTLRFWFGQDRELTDGILFGSRTTRTESILTYIAAIERQFDVAAIWGNGASFDCTKLEHHFERYYDIHWPFAKRDRDARTLIDAATRAGFDVTAVERVQPQHDPLCDALWLASVVTKAFAYLAGVGR